MSDDKNFYDIWEEDDKPTDLLEKQNLEIARLRAKIESTGDSKPEKVYIVRGEQIFVCHKSGIEMKRKKLGRDIVRDINIKDARMVVYGPDGLRKVDN